MGVIEDDLDITGEYRWPKNKIRDSVEYYLLRNTTIQLYGVYYLYFYTLYDLYIELCA